VAQRATSTSAVVTEFGPTKLGLWLCQRLLKPPNGATLNFSERGVAAARAVQTMVHRHGLHLGLVGKHSAMKGFSGDLARHRGAGRPEAYCWATRHFSVGFFLRFLSESYSRKLLPRPMSVWRLLPFYLEASGSKYLSYATREHSVLEPGLLMSESTKLALFMYHGSAA